MLRACLRLAVLFSPGLAGGIHSKCVTNFLKQQENTIELSPPHSSTEEEPAELEIERMRRELGSHGAPCLDSAELATLYPRCQLLSPDQFRSRPSFLVDINNGRLGNQMSSVASGRALAAKLGVRQLVTHFSLNILQEFFLLGEDYAVLEAEFCLPCSTLPFVPVPKQAAPTGQAILLPAYPNLVSLYRDQLHTLRYPAQQASP